MNEKTNFESLSFTKHNNFNIIRGLTTSRMKSIIYIFAVLLALLVAAPSMVLAVKDKDMEGAVLSQDERIKIETSSTALFNAIMKSLDKDKSESVSLLRSVQRRNNNNMVLSIKNYFSTRNETGEELYEDESYDDNGNDEDDNNNEDNNGDTKYEDDSDDEYNFNAIPPELIPFVECLEQNVGNPIDGCSLLQAIIDAISTCLEVAGNFADVLKNETCTSIPDLPRYCNITAPMCD